LWVNAEAAQKALRKRGVVLASKKFSRTAAEGILAVAQTENKAVVVELNCETDFVARNDIFQYLVSFGLNIVIIIIIIIIKICALFEYIKTFSSYTSINLDWMFILINTKLNNFNLFFH